jgi:Leucine-rich repeat (LRR) protein
MGVENLHIEELRVNGNQLKILDDCVCSLSKLKILDIGNNVITKLR